jgi:hypothetical protein
MGTALFRRLIGAVGALPVPAALATGASGSWMTTAWAAGFGTVSGCLHFGHGPVRPANWSLTVNRALQPGQTTGMGIAAKLGRRRPAG